ncbi:MAG: CoA-binding protein [Candidatus Hodarchaeota archaeon]
MVNAHLETRTRATGSSIPFDLLFNPRAVAIPGANKSPYGGTYFLDILTKNKFPKPIYPVNPKLAGESLYGYEVYKSIDSLPDDPPVDLAIIAVPAKYTPDIIKELGLKGIPFAHIFSSGYSEVGATQLEQELLENAREYGVRIVGPNCIGGYNPRSRQAFTEGTSNVPGDVGFISQSGGNAIRLALNGPTHGYYFSKVVSIGNQIDLDIVDFLEYFKDDPETKIIAMYVENVKQQGRRFIKLLKETTLVKPVVIWKGGSSEAGHGAVISHTGGLAGDHKIWKGLAKQTGTILVDNFKELTETIQAISFYPLPKTLNVGIVVAGGGLAVEGADNCEKHGLKVSRTSEETQEKLKYFVPPVNTNINNPIDLGAIGLNTTSFGKTIRILEGEPDISTILITHAPEEFHKYGTIFKVDDFEGELVQNLADAKPKDKLLISIPVLLEENMESVQARENFVKKLQAHKIMCFSSFGTASRCIKRLLEYHQYLEAHEE